MQISFKSNTYAEFQHNLSCLAAQLNSKPHIVSVVVEPVEEVVRADPEAREDVNTLIAEMVGVETL